MIGANVLSVACAVALLAWVLMFGPDLFVSTGLMLLYMAGAGACSPAASTKAMSVDPRLVGSSAGLFGFFQMAVGAASSAMAAIGPDASLASAVVLVVSGLLGLVAFSVARRYDAG